MQRIKQMAVAAALAMAVQSTASAQVQFYNGDFDGTNGLSSEQNTIVPHSMAYENFTIGGAGIYLTGIFGQFQSDFSWANGAAWEVRSGMSSGNGGTLLFSGVGAISQVLVGAQFGMNVYSGGVSVAGHFLGAGEYWFGLSPIGTGGSGRAFVASTSGVGGVNSNLDGLSYFNSAFFGSNFQAASELLAENDFSLGISGRAADSTVPEPATMTLLATGLAGLAGARRRKRTNA